MKNFIKAIARVVTNPEKFLRETDWKTTTPEYIKKRIARGADVNITTIGGYTPLFSACEYSSDEEVVATLIANGADVNARNMWGWTPLIVAAWHTENPKILQVLLDNGADINARDHARQTALIWAIRWGNVGAVHCLLDNGADVAKIDDFSYEARWYLTDHKKLYSEEEYKVIGDKIWALLNGRKPVPQTS